MFKLTTPAWTHLLAHAAHSSYQFISTVLDKGHNIQNDISLYLILSLFVHTTDHRLKHVELIRIINTLRTGDADLHFYITTVQDGWSKSAFLTRTCFPWTIHLIMQYIEPVSEWSWRMFIETWPHSELTFRHRASCIYGQAFHYSPENAFLYI